MQASLHPKVTLEKIHHRGQDLIAIKFPFDRALIKITKEIREASFTKTHKCWLVPYRPDAANEVVKIFRAHQVPVDFSQIRFEKNYSSVKPVEVIQKDEQKHKQALRMMEQKLNLKGYSPATRKNYLSQFGLFLTFFGTTDLFDLTENEIRNYLLYLVEKKKVSRSAQNQAINAIKFFYEIVLKQERKVYYLGR